MPDHKYVAILHKVFSDIDLERKTLTPYGVEIIQGEAINEDDVIHLAMGAKVVCVAYEPITRYVLENLENCKAIVKYGVGVDNIDIAAATNNGIWVANIPDYGTDEVATHAVALLLNSTRHISTIFNDMREGKWTPVMPYETVRSRGRTLGIVGFGRIGRAVARKVAGFEWRILVYDPNIDPEVIRNLGAEPTSFDTLLKESDFISIHSSLNATSYHLFDESAFTKMKPGSYLVNTARGAIVDTEALLKALDNNALAGAAVDVFEEEPLPKDHPILSSDRVVTTPHCAFYSVQAMEDVRNKALDTIVDILSDRTPYSLLNPEAIRRKTL